ncbi:MAG TPA: LysR family transcriptional regulator [Chloroflexia bacterium]|nr:LysR family transcriptional regulator [Chloroflexia bacterium]
MDVDQLKAFERIVREGSFSRAARVLGIAQPTISARIQILEQEVGGPLFERSSRKLTLTARGHQFLPYARRALTVLNEGIETAKLVPGGQRGRLSLGVLRSLSGGLLSPALADFYSKYPMVECFVQDGGHRQLVELLHDGVIELALIAYPNIDPYLVEIVPLIVFHEKVVLVASPKHPLCNQKKVTKKTVAELSNPFILMRWWQSTPASILEIAHRSERLLDLPGDTAKALMLNGIGVGFFNYTQVEAELKSGQLVEIKIADYEQVYRDSALVCLERNQALTAVAQNFVDCMQLQATRLGLSI